MKVFLQEKLDFETEEITITKIQVAEFMRGSNLYNQRHQWLLRKGEFCLNAQRRLGKEASLSKLFITDSLRTKFDMLLLFKI